MYQNVLVTTDGSDHAEKAVEHALVVAERFGATLHALNVVETRTAYDNAMIKPDAVRENLESIGEQALATVTESAEERGVELVTSMEAGVPAEEVLAYVDKHDIDWIFVGKQGHSQFKTVLLGSTAEALLHEADVPVTTV